MIIVGIDEVGRGCWAGPLVAGAVILAEPISIGGLKDSKKLSKKQRERLAAEIEAKALAIGLGWVWPADIDAAGLTRAVQQAMAEALTAIKIPYDEVIIDGNINYLSEVPAARAVIKADDSVPSASAASIVAKVARDNYMAKMAAKFPLYGFEKHVGYGTAAHLAALQTHGVCELHRKSYKPIQAIIQRATA
jgi:ribonuclease HII